MQRQLRSFFTKAEVKWQSYHFRLEWLLTALAVPRVFNLSVYLKEKKGGRWETAHQLRESKKAILGKASPINKRLGRERTVTVCNSLKVLEGISILCAGDLLKTPRSSDSTQLFGRHGSPSEAASLDSRPLHWPAGSPAYYK